MTRLTLIRRALPGVLLLCLLMAASGRSIAGGPGETPAAPVRPNIVLCMADDQGWGDVGYYDTSIARTPVLDDMAASGLRFDRFYAACAVCSPTRGSVLTGRHPNRFGCFSWGHTLRPEEITLAEAVRPAGYATGHFGKWHLGAVDPRSDVSPGQSGFDEWMSSPNFFENDPLMCHNGRVIQTQGEGSAVIVRAALDYIRTCHARQQPFLAVIWFGSPHNPHVATDALQELYADQPDTLRHYYGEITGIDRAMGELRSTLRDLDIADQTLVWYTSDNGPQGPDGRGRPGSAGPFRDRKGTLWEGGIRVPAIIEWPDGIPEPRVTDAPANTVDIFPTVLDLLDIPVPDQRPLDGISLRPLIAGESAPQRTMGFWTAPFRGIGTRSTERLRELRAALAAGQPVPDDPTAPAARRQRIAAALQELQSSPPPGHAVWMDGPLKLHQIPRSGNREPRYELYDVASDLGETTDLSAERPEVVQTMTADLQAWQQSVIASLRGADDIP